MIGKRFGDAGHSDLIAESNLLEESSGDQMLKGKHYSNAGGSLNTFTRQ